LGHNNYVIIISISGFVIFI